MLIFFMSTIMELKSVAIHEKNHAYLIAKYAHKLNFNGDRLYIFVHTYMGIA